MENSNGILEELLERGSSLYEKEEQTFFDIINKPNNENIMSRVLFFLLIHNEDLLKNLIYSYDKNIYQIGIKGKLQVSPNSQCEKWMDNGKADIFIECADEKRRFIVVIKNKIDSLEHDDQTQIYKKYVDKYYKNSEYIKVFIFLKPDWNCSTCAGGKEGTYKVINYSDLSKMIDESIKEKDSLCIEFNNHIKKYFTEEGVKMQLEEKFYFENYKKINDIVSKCENIKKRIKDDLYNKIEQTFISKDNNNQIYQWGSKQSIQVYDSDWWVENEYCFYVESIILNDDLSNIYVQKVVKIYDTNLKVEGYKAKDKEDGVYFIFEKERFVYKSEFLSTDWINELKDFCTDKMQQFYDSMSTTISNFKMLNKM